MLFIFYIALENVNVPKLLAATAAAAIVFTC